MKERGILMSAPMVKAILDGRKFQTRRIVKVGKLRPDSMQRDPSAGAWWSDPGGWVECPYGRVGDRLWVRETWKSEGYSCTDEPQDDDHACGDHCRQTYVYYAATPRVGYRPRPDRASITYLDESTPLDANPFLNSAPWRPSIHMPRWAARITLEVTDVRIQRLQEISEVDAIAEGVELPVCGKPPRVRPALCLSASPAPSEFLDKAPDQWTESDFWRHAYAILWNQINGDRAPWLSNPYVWAVSFRRVPSSGDPGGEGE